MGGDLRVFLSLKRWWESRSVQSHSLKELTMDLFLLAADAKKCRAYGRGIQPKGVRTGDVAEFRVITKDAGDGVMKATVTGPGRFQRIV